MSDKWLVVAKNSLDSYLSPEQNSCAVQLTKKPSVKTLSFGNTLALEGEVRNKLNRKAVYRSSPSE